MITAQLSATGQPVCIVTLRVTLEERHHLNVLASAANMSVNRFIRERVGLRHPPVVAEASDKPPAESLACDA